MSDREHGQARLSTVGASGELLMAVVSKDRVEGIKAKVANAREDWKSLMNNLQMREDALKVCYFCLDAAFLAENGRTLVK